jgi:GNAT superfamily N-acetyltransferase
MKIINTRQLLNHQYSQINQMWNEEYPLKLKDRFPLLLSGIENYHHYVIEDLQRKILAWAVDFEKEHEIRFSIIVDSNFQGRGFGSLLVEKLKKENNLLYGWVIDHNNDLKSNGTYYKTPVPFYLKHGFEILNDKRIDNEMINAVKVKWNVHEK